MKIESEEDLRRLIKPLLDEVKETLGIEEIKEKERDWGQIIKEYPEILVWKRDAERYSVYRDKINIRKVSHLIGVKENFSIPMVKHHVNQWYTVFIPQHIHTKISHRTGDGKLEGTVG